MRSSYYSFSSGSGAAALIFAAVVILVTIVATIIAQWKLFEKAGEKGWKCLIPIYGSYVWYQLTWSTGAWAATLALSVLSVLTASVQALAVIISIVLLILYIVSCYKISVSYGKGGGFAVGLFFLPVIFYMILAFGQSEYVGPAGTPVYRDTSKETAEGNEQALIDRTVDAQPGGSRTIWILTGVFLAITLLFFAAETLLSMKQYTTMRGLFGSPFVGLSYYERQLSDSRFFSAIFNSVLYGAAAAVLSLVTGFAGAALGKGGNAARKMGIAVGLLLTAIPRLFWESFFWTSETIMVGNVIGGALPWCGLSLAAGALLSSRFKGSGFQAALIVPVMRVITLLCGQNGIVSLLSSAIAIQRNGMSADYFLYYRGLLNAQYALAASGYVVTALINALFAAGGAALLAALLRRTGQERLKQRAKFAHAVPGIAAALLLILGGLLTSRSAGNFFSGERLTESLGNTLVEMILAAVLGFGFFLLIQLLAGKKGAPGGFSLAAFIFALFSLSQMWLTKFLLVHSLGLLNTVFAVALSWLLNPLTLAFAAVLALSRPASTGECVRNAAAVAMMALVIGIGDIRGSDYYLRYLDLSTLVYRVYNNAVGIVREDVSTDSVRMALWGVTMLVTALPLGAGIALTCMSPGKE